MPIINENVLLVLLFNSAQLNQTYSLSSEIKNLNVF